MTAPETLARSASTAEKPEFDDAVTLRVEVGGATVAADLLEPVAGGRTLALEQATHDPVAVYAGSRLVARGQLVLRDGFYFVRVTEVIRDDPAS